MKNSEEILSRLRAQAQQIEIPEGLEPEQMRKKLGQQKSRRFYRNIPAVAACLCVVAFGAMAVTQQQEKNNDTAEHAALEENVILETAEQGLEFPKISYEDIYASMEKNWEASYRAEEYEPAASEMMDGFVVEESSAAEDMAANSAEKLEADYGVTNVQTVGVDEGDIVKNDGRYLYQKVVVQEDGHEKWAIQILDTREGLKEVHRVGDFQSIEEFYVWEDVLVVIESKYLERTDDETSNGSVVCYDVAYFADYYHEISFYNISDRSMPTKIKTFTLQGRYASSRISEGYFYGFSRYYADPGNGEKDYDAYIPTVDGIRLQENKIYLPEENEATSYLVFVAVDLSNPVKFTDTSGIVSGGETYYVSADNIYVADSKSAERENGWCSDTTSLLKFSYEEGKFSLRAMGEIKGYLENSFSMDEYEGNLRVVSTVSEYYMQEVTDDRTGEIIGSQLTDERQTNAVYVLDKKLKLIGKIENLAEDEQIYSARFMGDTGYFVTFRQTDPLFTVDLTDPEKPRILSELKVSGFSEYLHIYGEDRLLGIGMEADEDTGIQEGMKLSMFDVSDKSNVKEIAKLRLEDYDYSEALYNHRAVLINPVKNIFGFEAEGSQNGNYVRKYFVFAYENDTFVQKLKIDAKNDSGRFYEVRGTYIGDTFYLLRQDGSVESYDLNTGKQLESLEP